MDPTRAAQLEAANADVAEVVAISGIDPREQGTQVIVVMVDIAVYQHFLSS
jgi:hypothetical protein